MQTVTASSGRSLFAFAKSDIKNKSLTSIHFNMSALMKQYTAIKEKYPDAILLFRVGDFYESFNQDAITLSSICSLVLTKRTGPDGDTIHLSGFPFQNLDTYLPQLVKAGHRVAICDQLTESEQKHAPTVQRSFSPPKQYRIKF